MEDLRTGEPPFNLEFPGGRFAVEDLVPKTFAEIDAVTGAARALVRHHALDLFAVDGDRGHATTVFVLVGSWCIVRVTAKGVWRREGVSTLNMGHVAWISNSPAAKAK